MKKKLFLTAILTLLCCTLLIAGASADYSGKPVTPKQDSNGVYQIGTADELYGFADIVNGDNDACAVLTNDITIQTITYDSDGKPENTTGLTQWTPIDSYAGTFDGAGHTIRGLYYSVSGAGANVCAGLFGSIGEDGTVKNVKIADSYIKVDIDGDGVDCYVGGVCGYNSGTITNCSSSGTVSGTSTDSCIAHTGGVCGGNEGTITNCYNTGSVTGSGLFNYVGGMCGENHSTITNCYNDGKVNGQRLAGGVCGYNVGGTIENCYNTGEVKSYSELTSGAYAGGVCWGNEGKITNCYNTGSVTADGYTNNAHAGGVCVDNLGTLTNCYNTGAVSGGSTYGVCGSNTATITNCFWLKEEGSNLEGIGSNTGTATTTEKTTTAFASGEVTWLLNQGQDDGGPWRQNLGDGTDADPIPVLDMTHGVVIQDESTGNYKNLEYVNGFGTDEYSTYYQPAVLRDGVWQISNAGQLYWFAAHVNSGDYSASAVLTANITINKDMTANQRPWTPIGEYEQNGEKAYTGTFDGQGHTISGLYYSVSNTSDYDVYAGLFGYIGKDGTVENVNIVDSYISADEQDNSVNVGGVCGASEGTIENCSSSGTVSGRTGDFVGGVSAHVGGVCGLNAGTITNCYNTGDVSGYAADVAYVGGVCGVNQGVIKECYNNGDITSDVYANRVTSAGGVCGYNVGGTIENCYNTGTVNGGKAGGVCGDNRGTIENCYNTGDVSGDAAAYVGGVCGYNNGATITNCYWLDTAYSGNGIGGGAGEATKKTAEAFASGEVAWRLNQGQTGGPWRQNLDVDNYPVLDSTHGEIVKLTVDGTASYHNSPFEFEGETGKAYFDETGKRIGLPYEVTTDTTLTSKLAVTVTADSFDLFVGDAEPTLTCTISPEVEVVGIDLTCDANMYTPGVYEIKVTGPEYDDLHVYTYVPGKLTVRNSWIVTVDGEVNYVHPGKSFTLPPAPSKPGYIFMGWSDGKTTWQPGDTVDITSDLTIKAVWANMPDITPSEPSEPEALPFTDVSEGSWYYDAVCYVWKNDIMEGVAADEFAPNSPLTRAMVWAVLARIDGVEVSGDNWMAVAQKWAVNSGVSDGTNPMGYITREQLVTMLWRYKGSPVVEYAITAPDASDISDWALDAMKWAASTGLIEGDETGALNPASNSTRAHAATFFMRYLEK